MNTSTSEQHQAASTDRFDLQEWYDACETDPSVPLQVLVVDDSKMQRKLLTSSLRKWGYEVLEASSGEEGLELCAQHDVSLILSDWMMPGMTGTEFCLQFRKMARKDYGYFILLTSKGASAEVAEGLNSGADDFLTKPVSFGELRARLRAGERILNMQKELIEKNNIVNSTLERIETLYDALNHDLSEARHLQQSLVRETDIQFLEGRIALNLTPSGHVGGDLVGQFRINSNQIAVYSLDVSGHGVTSALMTARLAGYLSGLTPNQNLAMSQSSCGNFSARDPADTVSDLNELLLRELETEHYFTIALCVIDLSTGIMRSVQAGHAHPLLLRDDGTVEHLGDGGMPVGLIPDAQFETFETVLRPGDRLVLYSDGITECTCPSGDMLEEEGLGQWLGELRKQSGPDALAEILTRLAVFAGHADFDDDVSAAIFDFERYTGQKFGLTG